MSEEKKPSQVDMEKIKTIILPAWEMRRKHAGLNPSGKKVIALQHEFIVGGIAVLDALRNDGESCVSPLVYFSIIRGEYITATKHF